MRESFDLRRYPAHLVRRWPVIAISCAVAMALAAGVSSLQTRQFTARARILIIPPTSESFPPTALSPTYMESLRTYEYLATSETLLKKAMDDLGIVLPRDGRLSSLFHVPLLQATVIPGTRVLEIQATLTDPREAQTLAVHVAAELVQMSESAAAESSSSVSLRTETLRLVDPGIAPTSPNSSGLLLTLLSAFFFALVLSSVYLTFEFALRIEDKESIRKPLQVVSHG